MNILRVYQWMKAVATATALSLSPSVAQTSGVFVFSHVNVIPMTSDTVLADQTVIVSGGRVVDVGPASTVRIPAGSIVIDGSGKYLLPALSDMHVHLEGDAWNMMFPEGSRFTSGEIDFSDILYVYIANGITTIDVLFAFPEHRALRGKIARHEMLGPRLVLSRMIDGAGKAWPPPLGVWIKDSSEARKAIQDIYDEGYDRVKVYSFLDRASYDTILAVSKEIGIPVDGHIPFATTVDHVLSSGQRMIAHIEEVAKSATDYTPEEVNRYADLIARSDTWVTSSLILNRNLNELLKDSAGQFTKAGMQYLHPMASGIWSFVYTNIYKPIPARSRKGLVDQYERFQRPFAREFTRKGGKLLVGTDALVPSTIPGLSLHEELAELVSAGLRPYEALRASTTNPFIFLGEAEIAGTIERGKVADLLLLDGNPLEDISRTKQINGVVVQDRWISRAEIDRRLAEIAGRYARLRDAKGSAAAQKQ